MRTKAIFDNIAEHLEEQIDLAENTIVVAVAWFTNKRLFDVLCAKAADGVKVKLIISDNEINRNSNIDYSDIQIGRSKLYLIDEEKMHNKFCIIDDYIVITGSYNWSYRAESNSNASKA
jgi:phosphatidylserine/phosphatidylglycerophosphate/cardiolipin synthase-like enzyme